MAPDMAPAADPSIPGIKALREAIPARCFERSLLRSLSYVARDLVAAGVLFYSAVCLTRLDAPWTITVPLWVLYSFVQGLFFTGLWILAHECGHDSFSSHLSVNAAVGWALHSVLLVPFFSWKFSHSRHHRYANHMKKDTVFVPNRKPSAESSPPAPTFMERLVDHDAADMPIVSLVTLVFHQLFGWPAYILLNAGAGVESMTKSRRGETPKYKQSHLDPTSPVFTAAEGPYVLLSNAGLVSVLAVLYQVAQSLGYRNTFLMYGLPYLWMNHWIGTFYVRARSQWQKLMFVQWPSPTSTTRTPMPLTTTNITGHTKRAPCQRWIANLASLAATFSMASSSTMSCITSSRKLSSVPYPPPHKWISN